SSIITHPTTSLLFFFSCPPDPRDLHSFPTRRSSDLAVVVQVNEDGSEAVSAFAIGDTGFDADVRERAVTIVVEEVITFAEEPHRTTKNVDAAVLTCAFRNAVLSCEERAIEIVLDVAGDEEIEQAVVVVVAPRGPG